MRERRPKLASISLKGVESLRAKVEEAYDENPEIESYVTHDDDVNFDVYFRNIITSQNLKTLVLDYDRLSSTLKVQEILSSSISIGKGIQRVKEVSMSREAYNTFLERDLGLHEDAMYNDSNSKEINGALARIFAIKEPYREDPLVVISTAKQPPSSLPNLPREAEEILAEALTSNFLICGKTGAGKTYLLNYLMSKYFPKDKRLGIIQEFNEIYPPNEFTDLITIPPKKPGQRWNDLEFLTEQSNLMRYDYLLVGEIKGSEAWPFVRNAASGVKCGATTHGANATACLKRVKSLCMLADGCDNEQTVESFIKDAINYVIVVDRGAVSSISRLTGTANHGNFGLETVYGEAER